MFAPLLRNALLALAIGCGGAALIGAEAPAIVRPEITSLTIALEDGRSYALTTEQLQAPKGGAIFWGDWAVINLLLPQYSFRPLNLVNAERVLRLWFTPGASGQLPAFLVNTPQGPIYPLAEAAPQGWIAPRYSRPRVAHIAVGYADGRRLTLSEFALRDPKSGVMVWTDFAVANLLIPFYRNARNLPTNPEDVMRIWHQPSSAPARTFLPENQELPGFLIKPACIPSYLGAENQQ
ncbi:MAG: hypothetical protein Q8O00_14450 [Holophaga sp.]|nr:hypothetical protein [Holophaga sp.]